ncbi:MAG: hypothetical protein EZS28_053994 [Streblomastix strix]|uniref:Uncharacterized protein n=1 Tax=Streblomastix strix TaxID=222440 RepID=A0A5J4QYT6_9EUKA|nr:MAG: hypothetical protein EZS28_053994 [Streblomastix strix]
MRNSEHQIHSDLVKQLIRKIRMRFIQTDKEKQNKTSSHIKQRGATAVILVIMFTIARLAELYRTTLLYTSDNKYTIQTTVQMSPH